MSSEREAIAADAAALTAAVRVLHRHWHDMSGVSADQLLNRMEEAAQELWLLVEELPPISDEELDASLRARCACL